MLEKVVRVDQNDSKLAMAHMYVAFLSLLIGAIAGVLQGLSRAGLITLPAGINYYQLLTAHGVLLALVFTTYFIYGFYYAGLSKTMGSFSSQNHKLAWIGFYIMVIGTAVAAAFIILGQANVLYTFYPPLQANPFFYVALAVYVVGNWIGATAMLRHYFEWKKENKGEISPLFGFMVVATMLLWIISTIGLAITIIFQIIPWAFGAGDGINILLSRTLFWYFGHPLVYFWLMPAYVAWYTIIPKVIGGKLFSDSLARLAFILFLLLSFPLGFHHQLMEPGIESFWKFVQVALTFTTVTPSLLTAFSMFATFELAGREKGSRGLFGWVRKLPWGDVRFLAPMLGMLFFIPAGAGGIVNASHQMNAVVHNTLWVVGHFHISVGTTVVLTFFGVAYWLIPHLTGRTLTAKMNKFGVIQTLLWTVGMILMSAGMHILGLMGAPRRTGYTTYGDHPTALEWFTNFFANHVTVSVGGVILFISTVMMVAGFFHLALFAPRQGTATFPISDGSYNGTNIPAFFENWRIWIILAIVLILAGYLIPVIDMVRNAPPGAPPINWVIQQFSMLYLK
ncbi:b(o/a)3-type cytochrome-c oxidase subunit 1 [Desertibacillus haloalkaliphilus]|uniref:b(o/a)3-type cytochrome-c oxidase subunit 1 n=1 Tax=Desertibacillus haloalkaliphilus TaxID=1328930 RepID=UPI001C25BB97|nr:b(o/a)3-type cytochrome-c oxidase subunit 1 [Desertibacillus haloalkaliphilus]